MKLKGEPRFKWNTDGRSMTVLDQLVFQDSKGFWWAVPAGAVVDGASIPRFLWGIIGSPFVGKYRMASVVHDHYCITRTRPSTEVHRMFADLMKYSGVPFVRRMLMAWAVRLFGPKWKVMRKYNGGDNENQN